MYDVDGKTFSVSVNKKFVALSYSANESHR